MISNDRKEELEKIYHEFLINDKLEEMKDIRIHRGSSCFIHSFRVAKLAIKRALRHKKELDLDAILIASILHDYYLYDWRKNRVLLKGHGARHPGVANENAIRDFNINDLESEIILSHMWPINFKTFPNTTEARMVSLADKHIAFLEMFTTKRFKEKRMDKYNEFIKTLF